MLDRVGGIWNSANYANKQRVQSAVFPEGLTVSAEGFGTVPTHRFFKEFGEIPVEDPRNGVPRGIRTPVTALKGRCPRPG
jgi:hypothetical protein